MTPDQAKSLLDVFLGASDQPSVDGFNTFCVSRLAHTEGLKVVLSGLGSDELFGGYQSFRIVPQMVRSSRVLDLVRGGRIIAGAGLRSLARAPRLRRLGQYLGEAATTADAYRAMRGIFTPGEVAKLLPRYGCSGVVGRRQTTMYVPAQPTLADEVSYLEVARYMRNQLLRDSDVMSMSWSLELRVPFVDSEFVDAIAGIPASQRLARGKKLLLDAVPEIPAWVRNQEKRGFTFPFQKWMTLEWQEVFQRIERESAVPLQNWYRTWTLFALDSFLQRTGISAG